MNHEQGVRQIVYLLDFGKRLFRKQNIGTMIFLIFNTLLVMVLFQDALIGIVVYLVSLAIALSPVGEWILRLQQGCKPIVRREHLERLEPLFQEVYARAKEIDPSIPNDVKLFISPDPIPNAFATGRKTICLKAGLLELSDEQIKATLAHEFGHLSNKDTDLILVVTVGNLIVSLAFVFYRICVYIIGFAMSIANRSLGSLVMTFLIDVMLVFFMWLWTKIGTLLVMHSSRQNEYEADLFAARCGYRDSLIDVLDMLHHQQFVGTKGLWANLISSHPDPDTRIGRLQQL